ncbi:MAG: signal peptide peptidase SppA [Actinomycetota bacterium]|nr:signal peptide peptidase SppA [Actinomycetota bacterium]
MAKRRTKWIVIPLVILLVLSGLWFAAFRLAGGSSKSPVGSQFDENVVQEGDTSDKVIEINVVGEIFSDPDGSAKGASDTNIIAQLDRVADDDDVKAVILNLETPGGSVVASDSIYQRVLKLRHEGTPVIALMGDVAASGGYYIAAGTDEIVARPATWTGSIGVIAMLPNVEKAAAKVGIAVNVLKSGKFKDAGSPFRSMTADEQKLFQDLINEAYEGFVQVVADGRKLSIDKVHELADGRVYSGKQAHDLGLVDRLGGEDLAFQRAKALGKAPGAQLVKYSSSLGLGDILGAAGSSNVKSLIQQQLGIPRRPGPSYLWLP